MLTHGSICSGIEAASVAWHPLGFQSAWFAEIDKFPSAVLKHHWPEIPNLGDFTKIGTQHGTIDVLVGGTPCQAFSVAGLRKGLDDPRGNLTLAFLALIERIRPRWVVWENVPGVLSIDGGRVFGAFLGGLGQLGYGFAYRVLDAQFFGVPQRRRRIFVVGHLGDWRRAAAVLFERHSLSGHPAPSRKAGKGIAHDVAPCIGASGRGFERPGETRGQDPVIAVCPTLRAGGNRTGGDRPPGTDVDTCDSLIVDHSTSGAGYWREGVGTLRGREQDSHENLIAHSLRADGFDASEDGTGRGTPLVPCYGICDDETVAENVMPTMPIPSSSGGGHPPAIAELGMKQQSYIRAGMAVRRLTPRECERLQGFPDDYTLIPWRGKMAPDGPRYKALGNSMAVPVMRWIGRRIIEAEALSSTQRY